MCLTLQLKLHVKANRVLMPCREGEKVIDIVKGMDKRLVMLNKI